MTGDDPVTNRFTLPPLARAFLTIAGILALVDTFNVFTAIHDAAEHGQRLSAWRNDLAQFASDGRPQLRRNFADVPVYGNCLTSDIGSMIELSPPTNAR